MNRSFYFSITFVTLILGVMLAFQFRTTSAEYITAPQNREQELVLEKKQLVQDLLQLQEEIADLSGKLDEAEKEQGKANEALEKELARIKRMSGLVPLSGPGVEVLIKGSPVQAEKNNSSVLKSITDEHLLKVVNELNSAGAEAVAINGQRILAVSEIRLAGNHINVNATPVSPPYHIAAIGNGAELKSRLEIKGGIIEFLNEPGVSVEIQVKGKVEIPAYIGAVDFEYVKNVKD